MSCIIADSGPLIALAGVDLLHLPQAVHGRAMLTRTVLAECLFKRERVDAQRVQAAIAHQWLHVCDDPVIPQRVVGLGLDPGESTALALALETSYPLLLDEERGRRAAGQLSIPVMGLCGLLLVAKRGGLISEVLPLLRDIRRNGYFLSDALLAQIAELTHER